MTTAGSRMLVLVFDSEERARRAAVTLVGDGCHNDQIEVIGGGAGDGIADHRAAFGVPADQVTYLRERGAGRPPARDRAVPPEIRDGHV